MPPLQSSIIAPASQGLFPWQNDPAVSHAWIADRRHVTIDTGVSEWAPTKGGVILTQPTASLQPALTANFGVRNRDCLTFDGSNDYLKNDALAALLNGTSLPLSFCVSLQLHTLQVGHILSFARNVATPAPNGSYFVVYVSTTSAQVAVTRNNNSGSGIQGQTTLAHTLGTNRVVITQLYNGTTAAIRFNGAATSITAQTLGTAIAVDRFTLGASAVVTSYGTTALAAKVRALVLGPSLWAAATYSPIEQYLINE